MQDTTAKNFEVGSTIKEAWHLTKGSKWPIWAVSLVMLVIFIGAIFLGEYLTKAGYGTWTNVILSIVIGILLSAFMAGPFKIAIKRARGEAVSGATGFQYFSRTFPVFFTYLINWVIYFILFVVPVAALSDANQNLIATIVGAPILLLISTFMFLSIAFAADRFNSPFKAIAESFKRAKSHFIKILALLVFCYLLTLVLLAPSVLGDYLKNETLTALGVFYAMIVSIWIVPFCYLIIGITYHKLAD